MSLRKFMHPRNKYKIAPDFKELAVQYPEFRKVAIVDLAGKVKIDFKNEESLRILTEVLLKRDFGLIVKIPPNKLVPTLPLRLNYVLWLEDLMNYVGFGAMEKIIGIDIGTGAISIYPLLFAKIYGTHMIGTEVDESSLETATDEIQKNKLEHLIKVVKVSGTTILKEIIEEHDYHFSMCNPPFFEAGNFSQTITKKTPPRNAPTGNETELMIQGGERAFVTQMIEESIQIKDKIKIYTTMIGRKANLLYLIKHLKRKGIENTTWTEFCQGHTKRWGLAWTFLTKSSIDLMNSPVIRKSGDFIVKLLKEQKPMEIVFPLEDEFSAFDDVIETLETIMDELKLDIKELNLPANDFDGWACQLTAGEDSWSHARRKRRLAQRQKKLENTVANLESGESSVQSQVSKENEVEQSKLKDPFLVWNIFVDIIEPDDDSSKTDVKICMVFEKGRGGKNSLETFRQYLINKLNIRDFFQTHCCSPSKKKRKKRKDSNRRTTESNSQLEEATTENESEVENANSG